MNLFATLILSHSHRSTFMPHLISLNNQRIGYRISLKTGPWGHGTICLDNTGTGSEAGPSRTTC